MISVTIFGGTFVNTNQSPKIPIVTHLTTMVTSSKNITGVLSQMKHSCFQA